MSAMEITDELLQEAKNYLDITWQDSATDEKLKGQLRRGIAFLSDKTGVERSAPAFLKDDRVLGLLFNYLLYDRAGMNDEFVNNYAPEINSLRRKKEVARYEAQTKS